MLEQKLALIETGQGQNGSKKLTDLMKAILNKNKLSAQVIVTLSAVDHGRSFVQVPFALNR